ncbi:MAG: hypothetical protein M0Z46_08070 [Actinomycetota bacterium]|jgi:hypothetical protein|nr:hypothetical protein [Actinomycetota bacterium]
MTTAKDIKGELVGDLEATEEDAESVKGGAAKAEKFLAAKKTEKLSFFKRR